MTDVLPLYYATNLNHTMLTHNDAENIATVSNISTAVNFGNSR